MNEALTHEQLARHLNAHFEVERRGAEVVRLQLVEASAVRFSGGSETFSIVFRGPLDVFLPQAIYRFRHDAIGSFDLFIVPVGRDQPGLRYEAVFNRLRTEQAA